MRFGVMPWLPDKWSDTNDLALANEAPIFQSMNSVKLHCVKSKCSSCLFLLINLIKPLVTSQLWVASSLSSFSNSNAVSYSSSSIISLERPLRCSSCRSLSTCACKTYLSSPKSNVSSSYSSSVGYSRSWVLIYRYGLSENCLSSSLSSYSVSRAIFGFLQSSVNWFHDRLTICSYLLSASYLIN